MNTNFKGGKYSNFEGEANTETEHSEGANRSVKAARKRNTRNRSENVDPQGPERQVYKGHQ